MRLRGTVSEDKHELLHSTYGINYAHLPLMFRRGTTLLRSRDVARLPGLQIPCGTSAAPSGQVAPATSSDPCAVEVRGSSNSALVERTPEGRGGDGDGDASRGLDSARWGVSDIHDVPTLILSGGGQPSQSNEVRAAALCVVFPDFVKSPLLEALLASES